MKKEYRELLAKVVKKDKYEEYCNEQYQEHLYKTLCNIYGINELENSDRLTNLYHKYLYDIPFTKRKNFKERFNTILNEAKEEYNLSSKQCTEHINKFLDYSIEKSSEEYFKDFMKDIEEISLVQGGLLLKTKNSKFNSIIRLSHSELSEFHMKYAYPSVNGLYPHEILMLSYAQKMTNSNTKFPQFWQRQYNVKNPQSIIDKLIKEGFIKSGKSYELTEKGKKELSQQEYVRYIHNHKEFSGLNPDKYMDIWKMNSITKGKPNYPFQKELEKYR